MSKNIYLGNNIFLSAEHNLLINGSVKLSISEKEKKLLCYFAQHADIELSKRNLIEAIWESRAATTDDSNLTQLIYKIRRDLAAVNLTNCIRTIPGKGYQFVSDGITAGHATSHIPAGHERLICSTIILTACVMVACTLISWFQLV